MTADLRAAGNRNYTRNYRTACADIAARLRQILKETR